MYTGVIIEESLTNNAVLSKCQIVKSEVEPVTKEHKTPHLKQWTLHTVEIDENQVEAIAQEISTVLDTNHGQWYADVKNNQFHYIIFHNKIFKVNRSNPEEYIPVTQYGLTLNIPEYQLDFSPDVATWQRNNKIN